MCCCRCGWCWRAWWRGPWSEVCGSAWSRRRTSSAAPSAGGTRTRWRRCRYKRNVNKVSSVCCWLVTACVTLRRARVLPVSHSSNATEPRLLRSSCTISSFSIKVPNVLFYQLSFISCVLNSTDWFHGIHIVQSSDNFL